MNEEQATAQPLCLKRAVSGQQVLQLLMLKRRMEFLQRCSEELPKAFTRNRFHREEFRNQFEVVRIWSRCTEAFIVDSRKHAEIFPTLLGYVPKVLVAKAESLRHIINQTSSDTDSEKLEKMIEMIEEYQKRDFDARLQLTEDAKNRQEERELDFMALMIELMDEAERMESQKKEEP